MTEKFLQSVMRTSPSISLALHFRFIEQGDWLSDTTVSVRLLARVLWAIRPFLEETGPLVLRMEKLLYSQELQEQSISAWTDEAQSCRRWPSIDPGTLEDLDRIWVVVLTGKLLGFAQETCRRLQRAGRHPLLLGMVVSSEATQLQRTYLSHRSNCLGVLHPGDLVQLAFDSVQYQPALERMLRLLKFNVTCSAAAIRTMLDLTHPDQA